jgi:lysozyme
MRSRRPVFAVGAAAALASCAFGVACSLGGVGTAASAASLVDSDGGDGGPRRVCPSAQYPDGGWVAVDGLDTSDWDYANWSEVAASHPNLKYAFVRVSAGLVRIDTRFSADWAGLRQAGLIRGAYQYFKPNQSAIAQADLYLRRLREEGGLLESDFPPVADMETTNGMPDATVICRLKLWLTRVERETHRLPLIYTSHLWSAYFQPESLRYPLWIANYVGTPSRTCPWMCDPWTKWQIWQYADHGTVHGVYANADRDDAGAPAVDDAGAPIPPAPI